MSASAVDCDFKNNNQTFRKIQNKGQKNYLIKTYPVELGTSGNGRCCNNASEIEIKNINILFIIKNNLKREFIKYLSFDIRCR